jgi:hypothetical protein
LAPEFYSLKNYIDCHLAVLLLSLPNTVSLTMKK